MYTYTSMRTCRGSANRNRWPWFDDAQFSLSLPRDLARQICISDRVDELFVATKRKEHVSFPPKLAAEEDKVSTTVERMQLYLSRE